LSAICFDKQRGDSHWICRCNCGVVKSVRRDHLENHRTRSCGCVNKELASKRWKKHGLKGSKIYSVWIEMRSRCEDKNNKRFKDYGGRGIKVCKRWKSAKLFLKDMGHPPDGMTIDRKNNHGDYKPSNCRWATRSEQARNKRNNRVIEIDGRRLCLIEWSEVSGTRYGTIQKRLRAGKSPKTAVYGTME
jgi:hypothetical protein